MVARPGMTGALITTTLIDNLQAHDSNTLLKPWSWNDFPEWTPFTMTTTRSGRIGCL
jgi:hypothetical protein